MTKKRKQSKNHKGRAVGGSRKQMSKTSKRVMETTSAKAKTLGDRLSDYFKKRKASRPDDSRSPMRHALDSATKGAKKMGKKAGEGYKRFASQSHKGRRLHH